MLIEKLKQDLLDARKARDTKKASLLTTLVSEASMPGLNDGHRKSTDSEVVKVIKRFLDGVNTNLTALRASSASEDRISSAVAEVETLESYMPGALTSDALETIVLEYLRECSLAGKSAKLGDVMTFLRNSYGGRYDGVTAKNIAVSLITV